MTKHNADDFTQNILDCCAGLPWDWLMETPLPEDWLACDDPRPKFWAWLREIETADATRFFRWVKFAPRLYRAEAEQWYALVGGLGSGEWWYWSRRWGAINDDPELTGNLKWCAQLKKPLGPVLNGLFGGHEFVDIDMRFGSTAYWPVRKLRVDENGMPYDPAMQKALTTVKKPKPKKPKRVKWISLLDGRLVSPKKWKS